MHFSESAGEEDFHIKTTSLNFWYKKDVFYQSTRRLIKSIKNGETCSRSIIDEGCLFFLVGIGTYKKFNEIVISEFWYGSSPTFREVQSREWPVELGPKLEEKLTGEESGNWVQHEPSFPPKTSGSSDHALVKSSPQAQAFMIYSPSLFPFHCSQIHTGVNDKDFISFIDNTLHSFSSVWYTTSYHRVFAKQAKLESISRYLYLFKQKHLCRYIGKYIKNILHIGKLLSGRYRYIVWRIRKLANVLTLCVWQKLKYW